MINLWNWGIKLVTTLTNLIALASGGLDYKNQVLELLLTLAKKDLSHLQINLRMLF